VRIASIAYASLLGVLLLVGCSNRGQIVIGIGTDLPARGAIDRVSLEVVRRGETAPIVQFDWDLSGIIAKDYRLPGSFNLYAEDGQQPIFDVLVRGLRAGTERVQRRAALGILSERDLFVRLGLVATCAEVGCPASLACIEGECRAAFVDLRSLPAFRAELVDHVECTGKTTFIDTSTSAALPVLGTCESNEICQEGVCLGDPSTLPGFDSRFFVGGPGELFGTAGSTSAFFPVNALDAVRFASSATTLTDGRVLVVGGFDSAAIDGTARPVAGAVIYESSAARFRRIADPPLTLAGHTATPLSGGLVLFVGAVGGVPGAMLFDSANDSFAIVPAPKSARYRHTATPLVNGKVLLYGGSATYGPTFAPVAGAELFDPTTRTWQDTLGPPIKTRVFHSAVQMPDRRVLMFGGRDNQGSPTSDVEAYDPSTDRFSTELQMSRARALHTATVLSDGQVLLVGGEAETGAPAAADAELYVPGGILTPAQPSAPPLPRVVELAIPLPNDRVLFVAGATVARGGALAPAGGAYVYDHSTRTFALVSSPQRARVAAVAAVLGTGEVMLVGGTSEGLATADGGVPPDLLPAVCDPVALVGANGCPAAFPRCTNAGEPAFGPSLHIDVGPHCVAALATSVALGSPCVPGDRNGLDDNCADTTVCLNDFDSPSDLGANDRCQTLCHSDADCTAGSRKRCAFVFVGAAADNATGVCMLPCEVALGSECLPFPNTSCRLAGNAPTKGAALQAAGVCLYDGSKVVNDPCDQVEALTSCSSGNVCVSGTCLILCTPKVSCGGTQCMKLYSTDPNDNGYCQ